GGTGGLDVETVALPWQDAAIAHAQEVLKQSDAPTASVTTLHPKASKATREQPFQAELLLNQPITGRGSDKDVRHLEISLEGSQLSYQPGDALGVWPTQSEALVDAIISSLGLDASETIEINNVTRSLREWLGRYRELTQLTKPFLAAHAELSGNEQLKTILLPESIEQLKGYLETRQLIDL